LLSSIGELATKIGQIMLTSRAVADAAPFATIATAAIAAINGYMREHIKLLE
jgi:hypothetical protein